MSGEALDHAGVVLRDRLLGFEQLIDAALAEGGRLCSDLVEARRSVGLSTVVGQPVFTGIVQALQSITEARGQTVQAHRLLDRVGQALGFKGDDYGDGGKDPTGLSEARPTA